MTIYRPDFPPHLLNREFALDIDTRTPPNTRESESLALHRMLGFAGESHGRSVMFGARPMEAGPEYGPIEARIFCGNATGYRPPIPHERILAAASFIEGRALARACAAYPAVAEAIRHEYARKAETWQSAHLLVCAPRASEVGMVRKDHLHPNPRYCERLGMLGGSIETHETLLYPHLGERATVAILRETYEEIRDTQIADEMVTRMTYLGAFWARDYLTLQSGQLAEGVLHLFVTVARTPTEWRKWRQSVFEPGSGGLVESRPALLTRQELREALRIERESAAARTAYLEATDAEAVAKAAEEAYRAQGLGGTPNKDDWRKRREAARKAGTFPLIERGAFPFIAGYGDGIDTGLRRLGLID